MAYSSGGGTIQAYDLLVDAESVTGFQMARIARERPELHERWRRELWRMFLDGTLRPRVHAEFTLEETPREHEVIESRRTLSEKSYSIRDGHARGSCGARGAELRSVTGRSYIRIYGELKGRPCRRVAHV